jgi:hypothetical protein
MKLFEAHFDGKHVVLDEPTDLKPNTKVRVLVNEADDLVAASAKASADVFNKIWDNPLDAEYDRL